MESGGSFSARKNLELQLRPDWEVVKGAWDTCMGFFGEQNLHPDVSYALSMSTQELLENAVKYGHFVAAKNPAIVLRINVGRCDVTVEVESPIDPSPEGMKKLDDTVQWIRGYQNPFEAYVERLKDLSSQPYAHDRSGLGLTRVAYEGQCTLDFYVNEFDILSISAVYHRQAP